MCILLQLFILSVSVFMPLPYPERCSEAGAQNAQGWAHRQSWSAACWKTFPYSSLQLAAPLRPRRQRPPRGPHPISIPLCSVAMGLPLRTLPLLNAYYVANRQQQGQMTFLHKFSRKWNNRFTNGFFPRASLNKTKQKTKQSRLQNSI